MAQLLVVYGASLGARTAHGRTPLFLAAQSGRESVVRYLIRRGATLEDRDFDGRTALHAAAARGHAAVARHLLRKRAKPRTSSDTGETPLQGNNIFFLFFYILRSSGVFK